MLKTIAFEGCVGAGKTSLTNYFSYDLGLRKVLEEHDINPFLTQFYEGLEVSLETELTFLLIHYRQLKEAATTCKDAFILADFSIEKDLVYARLNLSPRKLEVFHDVYRYVIEEVGLPQIVIYIDLSVEVLRRRIFQRGRPYELSADPAYFKEYHDKVKQYFRNESQSRVHFFDVDDLELHPENPKLGQIRETILRTMSES